MEPIEAYIPIEALIPDSTFDMDQVEFHKDDFMDGSYDNVIANGNGKDDEVPLICDQQANRGHEKDQFIGMKFLSEDVVHLFYNAYAHRKGFNIRLDRLKKDKGNNLRMQIMFVQKK
ncbi:hypothetical protein AMTR_s00004p00262100, partial [Amborella trichopoda]